MKPRVHYADVGPVREGFSARVLAIDHPNLDLNSKWVFTSQVLKLLERTTGPVFDTHNTVYWPAETDDIPEQFRVNMESLV